MHRENMKKKRRELEQASMDAASDLLDTDSNATFAMVRTDFPKIRQFAIKSTKTPFVEKPYSLPLYFVYHTFIWPKTKQNEFANNKKKTARQISIECLTKI